MRHTRLNGKIPFAHALVAQWIERRPPEPKATVRVRPRVQQKGALFQCVFFFIKASAPMAILIMSLRGAFFPGTARTPRTNDQPAPLRYGAVCGAGGRCATKQPPVTRRLLRSVSIRPTNTGHSTIARSDTFEGTNQRQLPRIEQADRLDCQGAYKTLTPSTWGPVFIKGNRCNGKSKGNIEYTIR
jgi:hypothetical protein